jgi:hypothetical protein
MRFMVAARRLILGAALGLALTATVAACDSSMSSVQITANWERFFNSSTPAAEKAGLLQNGSRFTAAITSFSKLPVARRIGAKVTAVTVKSPAVAMVTYDVTSGGWSVLSGQTGIAVYQDGAWKVGDASLCALIKLATDGTVPSACRSAKTAPATQMPQERNVPRAG